MSTEDQNRPLRVLGIILIVFAIISYPLRIPLSVIAINFFLFIDNVLEFSRSINPVIMWAVLGLFIGLIYGSFVAWKKYRLEFKLNFISLGVFALFFSLLFLINKPLASKAYDEHPANEVVEKPTPHYYYTIKTKKVALLYSCPQTTCSKISESGYNGVEVEVVEFTNSDWCKVRLYNTIGYMKRKNLVFSRTTETGTINTPTTDVNANNNTAPAISEVSLSDNDILDYIRSNFKNEDRAKYNAFVEGTDFDISKIFLFDYNEDGKKDALVFITGMLRGGNQGLWGFGLYKNIGQALTYIDEIVTSTQVIDSVVQDGNNIRADGREYSQDPPDPHCCPSVEMEYTMVVVNDKITGLD